MQPLFIIEPRALHPRVRESVREWSKVDASRRGNAAVLRVDGPLMSDESWIWEGMPAIAYSALASAINEAAADQGVATIVLDIHCPGGGAWGWADLVASITAARASGKRIVAYAHDLSTSIGYWLACLCDEIAAGPCAMVGHIGTIIAAYDDSKYFEELGILPAMIASDPEKAVGYPGVPKSDAWRTTMQRIVDEHFGEFVGAVAKARAISESDVRGLHAAVLCAADAKDRGLVDSIESPDAFFARVASLPPKAQSKPPQKGTGPNARAKGNNVMEYADITLADLKAQRPDLVSQVEAQTRAEEAKRADQPATYAQLKAIWGNDAAGIVASQEAGQTESQARAAQVKALGEKLAASEKAVGELTAKVAEFEKKAGARQGEDPVPPSANGVNVGGAAAEHEFMTAVKAEMKSTDCKIGEAIARCAGRNPAMHKAYIEAAHKARVGARK